MSEWTQDGRAHNPHTYRLQCGPLSTVLELTHACDETPWEWWAAVDLGNYTLEFNGMTHARADEVELAKDIVRRRLDSYLRSTQLQITKALGELGVAPAHPA